MEKPAKTIKLEESGYTAHIKTSVTYGEHQAMQAVLMGAAKGSMDQATQQLNTEFDASSTIEWTFKKIQTMVIKLEDKDGKEISVDKKVLSSLPMADGQKLEQETDLILEEIKKKSDTKDTE